MRENTGLLLQIAAKGKVGESIEESVLIASANLLSGVPKWNSGNLLPSDHAGVMDTDKKSPTYGKLILNPSQSAQRADYIFEKIGKGMYRFVSPTAYSPMLTTRSTRSNPELAQAAARKLLGIPEPGKSKSKSFKVAPSTDARPKVAKKTATPTAHGVVLLPTDSPASIIANQHDNKVTI